MEIIVIIDFVCVHTSMSMKYDLDDILTISSLLPCAIFSSLYSHENQIISSEKMSPSEIAVQDGKQGNAKRLGDSCTVSLSIAKIVVSSA